jgi:hypothetical protein
MTINEIFLKDEISVRAFNTCKDNEIENISELKQYYNTYGSFKHFRNCGKKTDSELVTICLKYFDLGHETPNIIDIYSNQNIIDLLSDLNEKKLLIVDNFIKVKYLELSVRSSNALNRFLSGNIKIKNIEKNIFKDIYFNVNNINEVGPKSIPEIGYFIKEIKTFIIDLSDSLNENKIEESFDKEKSNDVVYLIEKLNRKQRQIINNHILILTKDLSVRSHNAILNFLGARPNLTLLNNYVFSKLIFDLYSLKNIGDTSVPELNKFLNEIKSFIKEVSKKPQDSELYFLEIEFLLKSKFKGFDTSILLNYRDNIFNLVDVLIYYNYLFNESETLILKSTFNLYNDSCFEKLNDVGKKVKLSGERVRQKRINLFEKFKLNFQFLKDFDKNILFKYRIDFNCQSIIITDEDVGYINSIDNTKFSKQFLTYIYSVFLQDEFVVIGNLDDALILKESNARYRHNWQNLYLIKNKTFDFFDINKFIEDIDSRKNERNDETYKFNFKSYLSRFLNDNGFAVLEEILPICEKIISEEFNMFLSIDEEIIFERNTLKTLPEFALEALEDLGVPSHIDEINNHVRELNPSFDKKITNTNLKREFGFVPFGRKSVFGLKKWELENNTIKSGTIRSIAEEFLLKYDEPMHISKIAEYVLKYRPESNKKSIIYNLKMEDNNRFLFFKKSLIGLKEKKYDNYILELLIESDKIQKKTWEENYQELVSFIEENNRFPSSVICSFEEMKISRWFYLQKTKINKGILEEDKKSKINLVVFNNNLRENKTALYRKEGYSKLTVFILKEKRLPSAKKSNESQLYAFFYKQRKLFESGTLDDNEETKFIEIAKLIQNN